MKLRLYKRPFFDEMTPSKGRLLFEGKTTSEDMPGAPADFYLYVWIGEGRYLEGFQAVLAEQWVLSFQPPALLRSGTIGQEPMNRAVVADADSEGTGGIWLRAVMLHLECEFFADLLELIAAVVQGHLKGRLELSEDDRQRYGQLCSKI
jgi:hypothetical protein